LSRIGSNNMLKVPFPVLTSSLQLIFLSVLTSLSCHFHDLMFVSSSLSSHPHHVSFVISSLASHLLHACHLIFLISHPQLIFLFVLSRFTYRYLSGTTVTTSQGTQYHLSMSLYSGQYITLGTDDHYVPTGV
jgi:hypothetical protein